MAFDKTWTFSYNVTPTQQDTVANQARSYLLQLVGFLTAHGWSVSQSCDSTAVSASNLWVDFTDLVSSAGGARSWIVLKSPAGIVAGQNGTYVGNQSCIWFVIHMNQSTFPGTAPIVAFSFHNEEPTGGTTTAGPASPNQITNTAQFLIGTSLYAAYFHFGITAEGNFFSFTSQNGQCNHVLFAWPFVSPAVHATSGLGYPYAVYCLAYYNTVVPGGWTGGSAIELGGVWASDGTVGISRAGVIYSYGASKLFPGALLPAGDTWGNKQLAYRIPIACAKIGKEAYIGELADIYLNGQGGAQGWNDSDTAPTVVYLGNFIYPANVAVVL